jgi:hypothetical protein
MALAVARVSLYATTARKHKRLGWRLAKGTRVRAGLLALAVWAAWTASAGAENAADRPVDIARLCAEGHDRRARLVSVADASAQLECTIAADGAPLSCAVSAAAPDVATVRAVALEQMCYGRRADLALVSTNAEGERATRFSFAFDVACSRARGVQVCAASRLRVRQELAGEAGGGG